MTLRTNAKHTSALLARYQRVRARSLDLCEPLQTEDYVAQPVPFVSPPKWHLGHTSWFFENFILAKELEGYQLFKPSFNYCFNSYYQSQGPRLLRDKRGSLNRPPLEEVIAYREYVDRHLARFLGSIEEEYLPEELAALIEVGLQHEQQHQELLVTDTKYILGNNPLHQPYRDLEMPAAPEPAPMTFLDMEEGVYKIGYQGNGFSWDNEQSAHKVYLHKFGIAERLVTNGEYMEFMEAGGYQHFEYWLDDGWSWVQENGVEAPLYWYRQDGAWWHYSMNGLQKVDPNMPLTHINYYEANAFANWKGLRLPTEQEWEAACRHLHQEVPEDANFVEAQHFHPIAPEHAEDRQMLGNTWEWTASAYLPYPNYPRFKGALGEYNGKFMVNQMVLRGGSCATPHSHMRISYRNFFYPQERWQFTGLRLAK